MSACARRSCTFTPGTRCLGVGAHEQDDGGDDEDVAARVCLALGLPDLGAGLPGS